MDNEIKLSTTFDDDLAVLIGVNNSIVFSTIMDSIMNESILIKIDEIDKHFYQINVSYIAKKMPYFNERTVRRCIKKLKDCFILKTTSFGNNEYIIVEDTVFELKGILELLSDTERGRNMCNHAKDELSKQQIENSRSIKKLKKEVFNNEG